MEILKKNWLDLQSKRRQLKKMELFAYLRKASQFYQVRVVYLSNINTILLVPVNKPQYETIALDEENIYGFNDDLPTRIRISRPPRLGTLELEFATEDTMNIVIQLLRKVGSDDSSDSGISTSSPVE